MKHKTLFILLLFISGFAYSQDHFGNFTFDGKIKKAPYSFLWIEKGKLAVKEAEVSVDDYLTFLQAVSKDSSIEYIKKLIPSKECSLYPFIDTTKIGANEDLDWNAISWINEEKFKKDNNYPPKVKNKDVRNEYINPFNLPITGISYEQAVEYSKWCTVKFNSEAVKKGEIKKQAVIFRLPSPKEFSEIEKKGIESCELKDPKVCENTIQHLRDCKNEKGCALCNCEGKDTCENNKKFIKVFGPDALYGVYSFNPNFIGLYCMMGNAAEMTSEKGIAKGGSYLQTAKNCQPESVQAYTKPEKWLGLRLFAEVVDVDGKNIYFDDKGQLIYK